MKFTLILALAMAGLAMTASAQKMQKPKGKPSYSEERQSNKKGVRGPVEGGAARTSAAQELRLVEQSSAKVSGRQTGSAKPVHATPALKEQKKDGNPPIRFSAGGGGSKSSGKSADGLKGRLRQKGHR